MDDGNNNTNNVPSTQHQHGTPPEGMECLVTMDDIDADNYVEYRTCLTKPWQPALIEQSVVEQLLRTQFRTYMERVKTTDCQAELRRLLATGPPVYVHDKHGFPVEKDTDQVVQLWFSSDQQERSGRLEGSVMGQERDQLWKELQKFLVETGGSDEEEESRVD